MSKKTTTWPFYLLWITTFLLWNTLLFNPAVLLQVTRAKQILYSTLVSVGGEGGRTRTHARLASFPRQGPRDPLTLNLQCCDPGRHICPAFGCCCIYLCMYTSTHMSRKSEDNLWSCWSWRSGLGGHCLSRWAPCRPPPSFYVGARIRQPSCLCSKLFIHSRVSQAPLVTLR